jgi:hypothetical protein
MKYTEIKPDFNSTETIIKLEKFESLCANYSSCKIRAKGRNKERTIRNIKAEIDRLIKELEKTKEQLNDK